MLHDAFMRTLSAAGRIGVRAIVVHAKGDDAQEFYRRYRFADLPGGGGSLYLLLKDAHAALMP
jgi:hypothetical protein